MAAPTATISSPSGVYGSSALSVGWTYTANPDAMAYIRIKIYDQDGQVVLYDTLEAAQTGVSGTKAVTGFTLSDGARYKIGLLTKDSAGLDSVEVFTTIVVNVGAASTFTDNAYVGNIYEIGINGVGYMLADDPAGDQRYQRRTVALEAPRFATDGTSFADAVDRYTFVGQNDFTGGAGYQRRTESTPPNVYYDSEGVNPFEPGEISLLPVTTQQFTDVAGKMVVANLTLYAHNGSNGFKSSFGLGASVTPTTVAAAGTFVDITSDGVNWYATDGASIWRNSTDADPGAAWSTENANLIEWCTDRIFVARPSSGSAPNELVSITAAGALEAVRATLPVDTTITSITSGDGYVWFSAYRGDRSVIWAYQLGTTDAAFVALELPAGLYATEVYAYQGNVFVRIAVTDSATTVIYRCATSDGKLVATRVLDFQGVSVGEFAGSDRFVAFTWTAMNDTLTVGGNSPSGIGVIDLASGGWAKWVCLPAAAAGAAIDNQVMSVVQYLGKWVFSVSGAGAYYETTTAGPSGFLTTTLDDLGSNIDKVIDRVEVAFDPLPQASDTITVSVITENGTDVLTGYSVTTGYTFLSIPYTESGRTVAMKVLLGRSAGAGPTIRNLVLRLHPLGLADQVMVLPINCGDKVNDLKGTAIPSQQGDGYVRARALEELMHTRVRLQDIDWPRTQTATTWEVVAVDVDPVGSRSAQKNHRVDSLVATVTLRRSYR